MEEKEREGVWEREKDRKIDGGYYVEEKRELKAKRALKLEGENEFGVRERKKERKKDQETTYLGNGVHRYKAQKLQKQIFLN